MLLVRDHETGESRVMLRVGAVLREGGHRPRHYCRISCFLDGTRCPILRGDWNCTLCRVGSCDCPEDLSRFHDEEYAGASGGDGDEHIQGMSPVHYWSLAHRDQVRVLHVVIALLVAPGTVSISSGHTFVPSKVDEMGDL